jgi:hypothetical protein
MIDTYSAARAEGDPVAIAQANIAIAKADLLANPESEDAHAALQLAESRLESVMGETSEPES